LHLVGRRHPDVAAAVWRQIAKASSSNVTTTRQVIGTPDRELVVSSANVLDQSMPADDDPGAAVLLEPTHWSKPRLQSAMIRLDPVVGIPLGTMPGSRQQLRQHHRIRWRQVGHDLRGRDPAGADGLLEEPAGRPHVARGETKMSMTCPNWSMAR
jgi:hypothetical protein